MHKKLAPNLFYCDLKVSIYYTIRIVLDPSLPVLTLGWDGLWKEIDGGERTASRCGTSGGGGSFGKREGSVWEVRGEAESGADYL
jgi:hypothetical protein